MDKSRLIQHEPYRAQVGKDMINKNAGFLMLVQYR